MLVKVGFYEVPNNKEMMIVILFTVYVLVLRYIYRFTNYPNATV